MLSQNTLKAVNSYRNKYKVATDATAKSMAINTYMAYYNGAVKP